MLGAVPLSGYLLNILMQATTYAIAVIGLTVVLGLCGQINLAQAAFFGLGAYAVGLGTAGFGLGFWLCLAGGLMAALLFGAILGASTLRLGGHYLAMVTISFQQIVTLVLINWIPVTHGPDGVPNIGRARRLSPTGSAISPCACDPRGRGLSRLAVARDAARPSHAGGARQRARGRGRRASTFTGRRCWPSRSARCSPASAAACSPEASPTSVRTSSPSPNSIVFLTMALLGGVGSPVGAVIGTALLILLPEWLRFLKEVPGLYLAIYGLAVVLIVVFMPAGIWGFRAAQMRRLHRPAGRTGSPQALALTQRPGGPAAVLEIDGLSKHFGGLKAVDAIGFSVARGGVHALIGPNGSGKTTTLNVLSGLYRPTAGRIRLDGRDITGLAPHERAAAGLGRTFQNIRLFRSMSALDNVMVGAERPGNAALGRGRAALEARARAALGFVGLEDPGRRAGLRLLLRAPAADRDRAGAGRQPDGAAARRARRRPQRQREGRAHSLLRRMAARA